MWAPRNILDEHRALEVHGMLSLVYKIRGGRGKPNLELLGSIIYYIDAA